MLTDIAIIPSIRMVSIILGIVLTLVFCFVYVVVDKAYKNSSDNSEEEKINEKRFRVSSFRLACLLALHTVLLIVLTILLIDFQLM
ncbi:hypothetical protein GOM49_04470 [Clostridium bovifaecis]|uniref:Uncharacterized protein n=1 Tax=Clostridium bovifaecis TaxID=2184719 RepID=A0A6I6F9R0_9CLOT|nr:hypothetical protein GOM49_04470 [Clostridium bovifaecis]